MKHFAIVLLFSLSVKARVTVAFIEMRNWHGQVIQLEPGGRFAHSAISYKGLWLQAHPVRGVELVSIEQIRKMGEIKEFVDVPNLEELDDDKVSSLLGKPFDHGYIWDDEKIYCSELIAKLLDLPTKPMVFSDSWPKSYQDLNGLPGLSPDGVYQQLKQQKAQSEQ